jgi:hypothetical protein
MNRAICINTNLPSMSWIQYKDPGTTINGNSIDSFVSLLKIYTYSIQDAYIMIHLSKFSTLSIQKETFNTCFKTIE